jgi:hypothetical protein
MNIYDITLYIKSIFLVQWFIITIKPNSKENFVAVELSWLAGHNLTLKKVAEYSKIHYHAAFQNLKLRVVSVAFTS